MGGWVEGGGERENYHRGVAHGRLMLNWTHFEPNPAHNSLSGRKAFLARPLAPEPTEPLLGD